MLQYNKLTFVMDATYWKPLYLQGTPFVNKCPDVLLFHQEKQVHHYPKSTHTKRLCYTEYTMYKYVLSNGSIGNDKPS